MYFKLFTNKFLSTSSCTSNPTNKGQCEETPNMGSVIVCKNFSMVKNNFFLHCLLSHFRLQISQYTTITPVFKHCHCWNVPQLFIYPLSFLSFGLLTVCVVCWKLQGSEDAHGWVLMVGGGEEFWCLPVEQKPPCIYLAPLIWIKQ